MKKYVLFSLLLSGLLFSACGGSATADKPSVEAKDATEKAAAASDAAMAYTVDVAASTIEWEGYKPGQHSHKGTISISEGTIGVKDGMPESGNFTIDMNSLVTTDDMPEDKKANLEGHLKSGDFFEVEKFPTGTFEVTGVAPLEGNADANCTVTGNLTLKNITKSVDIPAKVSVADGKVTVTTPEFTINRTEWDVKYNSGILGTVKDKIIADDVKMKITLVGNAQAG